MSIEENKLSEAKDNIKDNKDPFSRTIKGVIRFENTKRIDFELYPDIAPLSVENFVSLCKDNFYDGLCFHRVIPEFMIQCGGFTATAKALKEKKSKKTVKGEFSENGIENPINHFAGVLSMARTDVKDSATSQFFITVADVRFLDGKYAAFGKITDAESLQVAVSISEVETHTQGYYEDVPARPIVISTIEILD